PRLDRARRTARTAAARPPRRPPRRVVHDRGGGPRARGAPEPPRAGLLADVRDPAAPLRHRSPRGRRAAPAPAGALTRRGGRRGGLPRPGAPHAALPARARHDAGRVRRLTPSSVGALRVSAPPRDARPGPAPCPAARPRRRALRADRRRRRTT